ncbi:MAG: 6,7-dimethyl-8-ribityllumazine synthase [Verrucomicrobia bacterium]|nr:6,7-dimethyl-8-ribityllumazine synthase [Verrucomicrobiota bacterium]
MVEGLLLSTLQTLQQEGIRTDSQVDIRRVPGANEIPYVANVLGETGRFDCIIALGVVVAGDTPHHEIIAHSTGFGLQKVAIDNAVPVINGIIVTNTEEQAHARCLGTINRGAEFALAAVEMAVLGRELDEFSFGPNSY